MCLLLVLVHGVPATDVQITLLHFQWFVASWVPRVQTVSSPNSWARLTWLEVAMCRGPQKDGKLFRSFVALLLRDQKRSKKHGSLQSAAPRRAAKSQSPLKMGLLPLMFVLLRLKEPQATLSKLKTGNPYSLPTCSLWKSQDSMAELVLTQWPLLQQGF